MMIITKQFKIEVREALLAIRPNFDGSDGQFAKSYGMNGAVYSRIKKGQVDNVLADVNWITIGRELNVGAKENKWKTARTDVFVTIEEEVNFCKEYSKSMMFVDDCEIGKTHTAKYLSKTLRNCFYVDGSQAKTQQQFIKRLARCLGVDQIGNLISIKENIKYYLKLVEKPIIIIDEAGDLKYEAFLELKEFWNATEGFCGWYMMGADGLRAKINRGVTNQKVGYREILSRFGSKYSTAVPNDTHEKTHFYKKLLRDMLTANINEPGLIDEVVRKCMIKDTEGNMGGLRRAESILILIQNS
jgi:hypothetical protein